MFGEISLIGWFHTIIGIAGILSGLYLLIRHNFINPRSNVGKFYLGCTFFASASSLFIYSATGGFNDAHLLSVLTMLAIFAALVLDKNKLLGSLTIYAKELALSVTVLFSMLPTTAEVLPELQPKLLLIDSSLLPLSFDLTSKLFVVYFLIAEC